MAGLPDRDRLVAIFESHRQSPGTEFDAGHFLDFLLDAPGDRGVVGNSFAGLRRFNAFIDEVQLEYAVCFSLKDRDRNYSLDQFNGRICALRGSPQGSLASLRSQKRAGLDWSAAVLGILVTIVIGWALRHFPIALAAWVTVSLLLGGLVLAVCWRSRQYLARLEVAVLGQRQATH